MPVASHSSNAFRDIAPSVEPHFVLHFYAAVCRIVRYLDGVTGESGGLQQAFDKFPFLGEYFTEMRRHMPPELTWSESSDWWRREITAWEAHTGVHLPLAALFDSMDDGFDHRIAWCLAGMVEEDSRFGAVFASLQPFGRRPGIELIARILVDEPGQGGLDPWSICRPLIDHGLFEVPDRRRPRTEWELSVPAELWDVARGMGFERPASDCRHTRCEDFSSISDLIYPAKFLERLRGVTRLVRQDELRMIVLRADAGTDVGEVAGAIARELGRGLFEVASPSPDAAQRQSLLARMLNAVPLIRFELGPGESVAAEQLLDRSDLQIVALGTEGGLDARSAAGSMTLEIPAADAGLRRRLWMKFLNGRPRDDLETIGDRFQVAGGYIRTMAESAARLASVDGRDEIQLCDVREASRSLNRQLLDNLADPLPADGGWDDLIATDSTREKLHDLARRCRHREKLAEGLGPAFQVGRTQGVRALLTGPSGTGKTMAARILAAELGMDLYRVDLASVINKYIGETEKNLHRVLSRAESLDVVLLLDEGDALLGRRTEVKSANDRYANLETNYLLQRLEHYRGILLITTNLRDGIDSAFQRRMDVVVPFFAPQADERRDIFDRHLPANHAVDAAFLDNVAARCRLTGGQIRNAILSAASLALDRDEPLSNAHIQRAVRGEYHKTGATSALDERTESRRTRADAYEDFVTSLEYS